MDPIVEFASQAGALLAIAAQIASVAIVLALIFKNANLGKRVILFFGTWALSLSFLIALGALAASLFYSEYAGFEPCTLCWYQRIFIYPQVFLLGLGLYKKDASILRYTIWLSVVGAIIAGYHSLLQFGFVPALPCSAAVVSCTQRFVSLYGYITIPVMSFAAFVLSVCLALANRKTERQA